MSSNPFGVPVTPVAIPAKPKLPPVYVGGGFSVPSWFHRGFGSGLKFGLVFLAGLAGMAAYHQIAKTSTSDSVVVESSQSPLENMQPGTRATTPPPPIVSVVVAPPRVSQPAVQQPRLYFFHFASCQSCATIKPSVDQAEAGGVPVIRIDYYDPDGKGPERWTYYGVTAAPTFLLVSADGQTVIARAVGINPLKGGLSDAKQIKKFYSDPTFRKGLIRVGQESPKGETLTPTSLVAGPLQSTVRIKVMDGKLAWFGSGTIVESTTDESLIVSCAHIFKVKNVPTDPKRFANVVTVDLFDTNLVITPHQPGRVKFAGESYRAEVIDYDFAKDVSLLRIKPGKALYASAVVPSGYQPTIGEHLVSQGCPEGKDATAWDTKVVATGTILDTPGYDGFQCTTASKQGRSGGGIHLAGSNELVGVCNFASDKDNRGIYASSQSIHAILTRSGYGRLVRVAA